MEPITLGVNLGSLIIMRRSSLYGKFFSRPLPQLGPFLLEYLVGMKPFLIVLHQSLKTGRYKDYLQWNITRSYSSAYDNIWSTGVIVFGLATLARAYRKMVVMTTPTRGEWFERFMRGDEKKKFGHLVEALHEFIEALEKDWERKKN